MGISSSQLQPQELITFKKLPTNVPLDNIEIPERPENRRPTNVKWLIVLGVFILIFLPFMIYTLVYSDLKRLTVGYDQCGNICGQQNDHWSNIDCSGRDMTNVPYLQYDDDHLREPEYQLRHCVETCNSGYAIFLGRCLRHHQQQFEVESGQDVSNVKYSGSFDPGLYLDDVKWQIVISCLISILLSIGMLFLFRYAVAFVVWGILIGSFLGLLIIVLGAWYFYVNAPEGSTAGDNTKQVLLIYAIALTIVAIILGAVLVWCRKKIRLVILLLKEATKAIFQMPGLITVPIICLVCILFLTFLFVLTTLYFSSAGTLERATSEFHVYVTQPVMLFTLAYNFVIYLWLTQFFTGIQYIVIAGAVAKWYFARDKNYLGSPIITSVSNAFKFHLGTVALGSLIITLVQIIKMIILSLIKNDKIRAFVQSCVEAVESFFKFLSKNAYIITAMHGQAFIRSGKRAAKLIIQNIGDIIAINFIGDFVLGMAKLLIAIVTVLISMGVFAIAPSRVAESNVLAYFIIAVVALVVAAVSFGVFETAIDTIFICYCEDGLLNDGMARPYYMSRNLMEFVQSSKEIYGKK